MEKKEQKKSRKEYYQSDKWKAYQKEYYQNNKDKILKQGKEWREKNPYYHRKRNEEYYKTDKWKAYQKEYYQNNKEKLKEYRKIWIEKNYRKTHLKRNYGLTIEDYNKLVEQQNNKCAICGNEEKNTFKGNVVYLSIDHNHKTGKIRELLCKNCNVSLGNLNEDISLFYKCIEYLKQHQEDKEESKDINLKENGLTVTYKLTTEGYNKRAKLQNNKCAICGVEGNGKKLCLDHDWKTGKVRSLLCKNCNTTLGNLNEDISLFYKCIKYLENHRN